MSKEMTILVGLLVALLVGAAGAAAFGVVDIPALGPVNGLVSGEEEPVADSGGTDTGADTGAGAGGDLGAGSGSGAGGDSGLGGDLGAGAGTDAGAGAGPGSGTGTGTGTGEGAGAAPQTTTDGTNRGNTPEAFTFATEVAQVMQQSNIQVGVDATTLPARGGDAAANRIGPYRQKVTAVSLSIRLADESGMQEWRRAEDSVQGSLVRGFLERIQGRYPKAAGSVSVLDPTGAVLALGDAASNQERGTVTLRSVEDAVAAAGGAAGTGDTGTGAGAGTGDAGAGTATDPTAGATGVPQ